MVKDIFDKGRKNKYEKFGKIKMKSELQEKKLVRIILILKNLIFLRAQ